jgi:alkylation response protein AidB-like acyl-CoA dehydrogenase
MFGTEEQSPILVRSRAETLAAWGLTEASSGSDAAAMQVRAVRDGDSWVIDGAKQFITHGRDGDVIVVMAVTSRAKGSRGISAFIVEKGTPGFRPGKKEDKLGMRASDTSEVIFENCRPRANAPASRTGSSTRCGALTLAHRHCAEWSPPRARMRRRDRMRSAKELLGQPIGTFQSIRAKFDAAMRIEAARL